MQRELENQSILKVLRHNMNGNAALSLTNITGDEVSHLYVVPPLTTFHFVLTSRLATFMLPPTAPATASYLGN